MIDVNELRQAVCPEGLNREYIRANFEAVFIGYDWISDEEADLLDSYFEGKRVSVVPFGQYALHESMIAGDLDYTIAMSEIGTLGFGDFIITDNEDRFVILFDARNIYVFGGPISEVKAMNIAISPLANIERKYQSHSGDMAEEFQQTRQKYEHYRDLSVNFLAPNWNEISCN